MQTTSEDSFHAPDGALREVEHTVFLEIISPSFDERGDNWRFSDGEAVFSAPVLDEEFLARVRSDEIFFSAGSMIEAGVRMVQSWSGRHLKSERSIVKVLNFIPSKRRLKS